MSTTPRTETTALDIAAMEYLAKTISKNSGIAAITIQEGAARLRELEAELAAAQAECLEQARLLGISGSREASLIARAEKSEKLWKEFITLLEITEESDSGYAFNPNKISSCRVMDGKRLNEILVEARQIVF